MTMSHFNRSDWDLTAPGRYETQLSDGSIWRWTVSDGEISEVTDFHKRNPCLNASTLRSAQEQIEAWCNR